MTTTSSPDSITELRRSQLEKLLQITSHNFEVRFDFGARDRLSEDQVVLGIPQAQLVEARYPALKGQALRLLGHYLADARAAEQKALAQEDSGAPGFARLWHALEDARVENGMLRRWPGMGKSFAARLPPNQGGALLSKASTLQQLELGLYLTGRGIPGAQLSRPVRQALSAVEQFVRLGASGSSPESSLEALKAAYPCLRPLLSPGSPGRAPATEKRSQRRQKAHQPPAPPEIQLEDDLVWLRPRGRPRQLPEWYRPGSAPWFEAGLGGKQVHPSAMRSDRQTVVQPPSGDPEVYRSLHQEVQREAGFLAARLIRLLQEQTYLRFAGRYRSGQLEMNRLWKQRLADYRLFQRREESAQRALAVTLLIDESASMQGRQKFHTATKAGILLGETLTRLQIPLEIIGFTTAEFEAREALRLGLTPAHQYRTMRCSPLAHRLYKSFSESYRQVRARMAGIQARHNNWDEEHLLFAYRRLRARPEPSRLILVIGDGQPNGDANHLIRTAAAIERLGCKVVGIGIGEDFVRRIYRHAIVAEDFRRLAEDLLGLLASELGAARPGPAALKVEAAAWPAG